MKKIDEREKQQQQKKTEKNKGVTKAIVKRWELNDFDVHLR